MNKLTFMAVNNFIFYYRTKLDVMKTIEIDLKASKKLIEEKDEAILVMKRDFEQERDEKMILIEEKAKDELEWKNQTEILQTERGNLQKQVDEMNENVKRDSNLLSIIIEFNIF